MLVTLMPDRSDKHRPVAFIDNCIAFFPRNMPSPGRPGDKIEVMITGVQYRRKQDILLPGEDPVLDWNKPKTFFLRPIQDDDLLVGHNGFQSNATSLGTTAVAMHAKHRLLLTPGTTEVFVADNKYSEQVGRVEPIAGMVWIKKYHVKPHGKNIIKVEGLVSNEDCRYYVERMNRRVTFTTETNLQEA
jgi:hypothetical protein